MLTGFELGYVALAGGMLGRARRVVSTHRTCHGVRAVRIEAINRLILQVEMPNGVPDDNRTYVLGPPAAI
jgi:hypothetical protein